ncbi:MAG TPA: peptidylprolyl isomerase, partial [Gammaproteobacteria bacterium]|nr:peptidylprolyl isomerase [Gammaproteobacteria bacterium]
MDKMLPLIKVNHKTIDEELLACELKKHQYEDFDTVVQQVGQALVIRQLLLEQVEEKGMEKSPNKEDEAVKRLLESVSYKPPTEEECLEYFKNHPHEFMSPTLLDVDHILLAAPKEDIIARQVAKNKAMGLIEKLKKNPLLFAALAEQHSDCSSKKTGGFLG